jgi:uncharacterized membrane protein YagU involved in acid resistance
MKGIIRKPLLAVLLGGAAAGTADIIAAVAGRASRGGEPISVLQGIASGLLGKLAFQGGWLTGAAGLAVHFGLTTIMAALFVLAAQRWAMLWQRPWLFGLCYGALIYFAMSYVIVPHSAIPAWKTPEGFWAPMSGILGHGFFVGVPIACVAQHFLGQRD